MGPTVVRGPSPRPDMPNVNAASKRILLGAPAGTDLYRVLWTLSSLGHTAQACTSLPELEAAFAQAPFDALVLSMDFEGPPASYLRGFTRAGGLALVCSTRNPTWERALVAMRAGASDYLPEPPDAERLVAALHNAFQRGSTQERNATASDSEGLWRGLSERERQVVDAL